MLEYFVNDVMINKISGTNGVIYVIKTIHQFLNLRVGVSV